MHSFAKPIPSMRLVLVFAFCHFGCNLVTYFRRSAGIKKVRCISDTNKKGTPFIRHRRPEYGIYSLPQDFLCFFASVPFCPPLYEHWIRRFPRIWVIWWFWVEPGRKTILGSDSEIQDVLGSSSEHMKNIASPSEKSRRESRFDIFHILLGETQ